MKIFTVILFLISMAGLVYNVVTNDLAHATIWGILAILNKD